MKNINKLPDSFNKHPTNQRDSKKRDFGQQDQIMVNIK